MLCVANISVVCGSVGFSVVCGSVVCGDVFDLNYRQYGVNRYLWFHEFPKKIGNVPCLVRILTLKYAVCGALV